MSKKINVNPGQYKVRGRERQGEEIDHGKQRAQLARSEKRESRAHSARAQASERSRTPKKRQRST